MFTIKQTYKQVRIKNSCYVINRQICKTINMIGIKQVKQYQKGNEESKQKKTDRKKKYIIDMVSSTVLTR